MRNNDLHRQLTALLIAVLMLTGLLSGCGKDDEIEQVTLRTTSIMGDDSTKEMYKSLLEAYSAEYPHVYHIGTIAGQDNAYKLDLTFESTYATSRYPHAVYYYTDTGIMKLTEQFVSVEEIREIYPDFAAGVTDAALDSVRSVNGKAYCVPFAGSWTAMAVNTKMLERYSLRPPETWQDLIVASGILSARGITAIANSPDDSAALLELLCVALAGERTVDAAVTDEVPLSYEYARETWLEVFRRYDELCGINSFPPAVVSDELSAALEQMALVEAEKLASQTSASDIAAEVSQTDAQTQSQNVIPDAIELFNSGEAAMLIIDSEDLERIELEDFSLVMFPDCTGDDRRLLSGSYDTAWFITRRAFNDSSVRDAVVAFVDMMVSGKASDSFAEMGYLPSVVSAGDVVTGLYGLAQSADELAASRRTPAASARFGELEDIAAALSMDIITPEQAVMMLADRSLELTDVIEKPQNKPAAPEPPAVTLPEDAPVSVTDITDIQ